MSTTEFQECAKRLMPVIKHALAHGYSFYMGMVYKQDNPPHGVWVKYMSIEEYERTHYVND